MQQGGGRRYDLEERTLEFARRVVRLCKMLPEDRVNGELVKQIVRSGASVGANYRDAGEALSKKDFIHRMKIARKEAKETSYRLSVLEDRIRRSRKNCGPLVMNVDNSGTYSPQSSRNRRDEAAGLDRL